MIFFFNGNLKHKFWSLITWPSPATQNSPFRLLKTTFTRNAFWSLHLSFKVIKSFIFIQSCVMWLTATFGAVMHHAKSFATPRFIRLLDFFFLFKNSARNFFLTRSICSIFFWGDLHNPSPLIKNQMVHPLFGFWLRKSSQLWIHRWLFL